jgi:hypothetical protein
MSPILLAPHTGCQPTPGDVSWLVTSAKKIPALAFAENLRGHGYCPKGTPAALAGMVPPFLWMMQNSWKMGFGARNPRRAGKWTNNLLGAAPEIC